MYIMKKVCEKTGLAYETPKLYCNQGLVPNMKRDSQNHHGFDDRDIAWINSLNCLEKCNMGIEEAVACIDGGQTRLMIHHGDHGWTLNL